MTVGSLGTIVFSVSQNKIETLCNIKQSGSASYGKHQRHTGNTLLEFVGRDADKITFDFTLSRQLGVDVEAEIAKLETMTRSGKAVKFVIGKKVVGLYRWVIEKYTINKKYFDRELGLTHADISISLCEYCKWK